MTKKYSYTRRSGGFSLVEIMLALGIFALGFIAIASLFPVAALLQKKTVEDIHRLVAVDTAQAMTSVIAISHDRLVGGPGAVPVDNALHRIVHLAGPMDPPYNSVWMRSYPNAEQELYNRRLFWVPMVRRTNDTTGLPPIITTVDDWEVFVIIMKRQTNALYPANPTDANPEDSDLVPKVRKITGVTVVGSQRFNFNNSQGLIKISDQLVDEFGDIHIVADADTGGVIVKGIITPEQYSSANPTVLWYAVPARPGAASPIERILVLSGVVKP